MKTEKIETKKVVSYIRGIYHKKEEWLIKDDYRNKYHREDGPALIYYYKDGTIAAERWYNNGSITRPIEEGPAMIEYYKNGNIKRAHWTCDKPGTSSKTILYYENGTIKEKSDSGTFYEYDSKYNMYMYDSHIVEYYENGNIKSEKRGVNKNCTLDKPIMVEYDINGNILKAKYFLYNAGYITQIQLNKCKKRLQSKRKIKTCDPKTLEILYHLAKKDNCTDKIDQIGALLVANKLTEY